ncbi:hypothetical protein HPB47_006533 [Ixodes persulcatus]|uniref:Uncharacterized protein n=1 Tax=Ixodes persulcatus TaxID=34615 RepID=A0AC60PAZ7_IXOPE|nr:hypothetical protein HPB47_006533 [Ixodes persulcatus]
MTNEQDEACEEEDRSVLALAGEGPKAERSVGHRCTPDKRVPTAVREVFRGMALCHRSNVVSNPKFTADRLPGWLVGWLADSTRSKFPDALPSIRPGERRPRALAFLLASLVPPGGVSAAAVVCFGCLCVRRVAVSSPLLKPHTSVHLPAESSA